MLKSAKTHLYREVTMAPAAILAARRAVVEIGGGGTVDGGDVLIVNDLCLVGISSRTNEEGARQLAGALMSAGIQVRCGWRLTRSIVPHT